MNEPEPVILNGELSQTTVSNENITLMMDPDRIESKEDDNMNNNLELSSQGELTSEDTISKNQDTNQKFSMIFITLFEIYRVLMSTLLLMFVPQECNGDQCSLSDKTFPDDDYEKFVACHNYVVMVMFFGFYYLEITRELYFINYLHTNRFKPRDNESVEEALSQLDTKRKKRIEDTASIYKYWGYICMVAFVLNTTFSSVAVFNNFLDSKSITVFLTNVMFMSTKLYDVHSVSNTKKYIFLSSYLTRKIQFNDVDPDKLIGVADELEE